MAKLLEFDSTILNQFRVFAIRIEQDGRWEEKWEPIRQHPDLKDLRDVLPTVSRDAWQKALSGWSNPLASELGVPPEGAAAKIEGQYTLCKYREPCGSHDPDKCKVDGLEFPPCFLADLEGTFEVRSKVTRIFEYWKDGVYVLLVPSESE